MKDSLIPFYYERIALSENKEKIKELSTEGQILRELADIIKDPYVLEFLGLRENKDYLEKDVEPAILIMAQCCKIKIFRAEIADKFKNIMKLLTQILAFLLL